MCAQLSREGTPFSFSKPLLRGATIWPSPLSSLGNGRARFTAVDRMPICLLPSSFMYVAWAPNRTKESLTSQVTQLARGSSSSPHCQAQGYGLFILTSQT